MLRTLRHLFDQMTFSSGPSSPKRTPHRPGIRLCVEELENRLVPTQSPFFLDASNQLFVANDATGQTYTNTGAFAIQLSVGDVSTTGGGGQFAIFRDGANRVYFFNGNNNAITMTNVFAIDVVAGRGEAFIRDGNNQIYALTLGAAVNPDGTFQVTPVLTAGYALQMEVGFNTTTQTDFLAYRAGDNSVHALQMVAGLPVYGAAGAFAIDLETGNQNETFIRDDANRVRVVTINTATAAGITFLPTVSTPAFALEMSVSRNNPGGNDYMAYRAGDNSVHFMNYDPATGAISAFVGIAGSSAVQVEAGVTEIFTRDAFNRVIYYNLNGAGTGVASTVNTNAFASLIRDTRWSLGPAVIDQLSILDGNGRLYVSQNNGVGDAIASFFDTGFTAKDVQGYQMFP